MAIWPVWIMVQYGQLWPSVTNYVLLVLLLGQVRPSIAKYVQIWQVWLSMIWSIMVQFVRLLDQL